MDFGALLDAAGGAGAVGTRAVVLGGTVLAAGAVAFRLVVARRVGAGDATAVRWGMWSSVVLLAVAAPRLWLQARGFVDAGDPVLPMMANVLQTRWGLGWSLQAAGALVALSGFIPSPWKSRWGGALCVAGALALVAAPALMGHAVAVTRLRWLAVPADMLHTLAASTWTGALTVLTVCAAKLRTDREGGATTGRMITAFHPMALTSAAVIVATGALGAWLRVTHLSSLLHTGYGAIFATKLVFAALVTAIGGYHSRRGAEDARRGAATLHRSLRAEVLFAALVIVATALLVGSPPEPDV